MVLPISLCSYDIWFGIKYCQWLPWRLKLDQGIQDWYKLQCESKAIHTILAIALYFPNQEFETILASALPYFGLRRLEWVLPSWLRHRSEWKNSSLGSCYPHSIRWWRYLYWGWANSFRKWNEAHKTRIWEKHNQFHLSIYLIWQKLSQGQDW